MFDFWPNVAYPQNFLLTSGIGRHPNELVAFDAALIDAKISNYNLLKISSILPKHATQREKLTLPEGSAVLTAYATVSSNVPNTILTTAVAVGLPKNTDQIGIIMELSNKFENPSQSHDDQYCDICENGIRTKIKYMVSEAMANHGIALKNILISSAVKKVPFYTETIEQHTISLVSAVCLW